MGAQVHFLLVLGVLAVELRILGRGKSEQGEEQHVGLPRDQALSEEAVIRLASGMGTAKAANHAA